MARDMAGAIAPFRSAIACFLDSLAVENFSLNVWRFLIFLKASSSFSASLSKSFISTPALFNSVASALTSFVADANLLLSSSDG